MALFGLGVVVLGPTLGAYPIEIFSRRAVFYVNLLVAAFADDERRAQGRRDSRGPHRLGRARADGHGDRRAATGPPPGTDARLVRVPRHPGAAFASVSARAFFFPRGRGRPDNVIDFPLLGFGLSMFEVIAMLPLFVQGLLGYPVVVARLLFMPRGLPASASMVLTNSVLMAWVDRCLLMAIGLPLTGLGNIRLAALTPDVGFWDLARPGIVSGLAWVSSSCRCQRWLSKTSMPTARTRRRASTER